MITNERQYRITNAQLSKLTVLLKAFDLKEAVERTGSVALAKAEREAIASQILDLEEQVEEYETLKSGAVGTLEARRLEDLPGILIKARIAGGLSQRELAEKLGVKEQQVQRYEAENYASASLKTLVKVAGTLGLEVSEIAELRCTLPGQNVSKGAVSIDWAKFPIREMYERGWFKGFFKGSLAAAIENADGLAEEFVLRVLPESTPALLRSHVRSGSIRDPQALLAWQCRILTLAAEKVPRVAFDQSTTDDRWLKGLVQCSRYPDGPIRTKKYLEDVGISLAVEPHLQHTHLDGAALLLRGRPVIGLTLRYDRLDNFWFTLVHEVIHVIKHLKKGQLEDIFDDLEAVADTIESEADKLAGNALVPDDVWETALARYLQTKESISDLANELKVSPAIIAGRIRKEADDYIVLTDLVGQGKVRRLFGEVESEQ